VVDGGEPLELLEAHVVAISTAWHLAMDHLRRLEPIHSDQLWVALRAEVASVNTLLCGTQTKSAALIARLELS